MTKICFVHDAPLLKDASDGSVYSQGFQYNVWQRYLDVFDSVIVCTRMRYGLAPSGMRISSGPGVKFVPAQSYKGPLSLIFKLPSIYKQVASAVSQTDAVILRLPSILGLIGYIAARRNKSEYLVELVGSAKDAYSNRGFVGRLTASLLANLTRRIVKSAPFCIYVTESYLQQYYPTQGQGVAISNVELETNELPKTRKKPSIPLRMGSAGQVDVPYKGYGSVISALVNLPNAVFEVAGGGDSGKLLEKAKTLGVQNQVKFVGRLDRDELFEWLDTLDIYLQPSLTEGLPRSVLEAMSRGLPVIATDVGGLPELLESDFLVRPGNADSITAKVLDLIRNEDFAQIGVMNYRRAQDFDVRILRERRKKFLLDFREHILRNSS